MSDPIDKRGNGRGQPQAAPQGLTMEMHVRWVNGQIELSAPDNPVLFMRLMGDIMGAYALNTQQQIMQIQSRIVKTNAAVVDERLLEKIKANKQ